MGHTDNVVLSFNLLTLVRLSRNLKRVGNYDFYLVSSHASEIDELYMMVLNRGTQTRVATFRLSNISYISHNSDKDIVFKLNDAIFELLSTTPVKEAKDLILDCTLCEDNHIDITLRDVDKYITRLDLDYKLDISFIESLLSIYTLDSYYEISIDSILKSASTMPFDITDLYIINPLDYLSYTVLPNESWSRVMLAGKEFISTPVESLSYTDFKSVYPLVSGLTYTEERVNSTLYVNTITSEYILGLPYSALKVGRSEHLYDWVYLSLSYVSSLDDLISLKNLATLENYSYSFTLNGAYVDKLYGQIEKASQERLPFLSLDSDTFIHIRDVTWLRNLIKKYGDLKCEVVGIRKNIIKIKIEEAIVLFSIYTKR